ncbi:MAG: hypothetical protein RIC55_07565 [Pirellulaceae bacterium]
MRITIAPPLLLCAFLAPSPLAAAGAQERQNVRFILVDDLGWSDVRCSPGFFRRQKNVATRSPL